MSQQLTPQNWTAPDLTRPRQMTVAK
uniref:Uncharacterized protein n=1 Tax=Anguilla anguilla TaxID=7936 RepID=A0A0E9TI99_ANGAN